MNCYKILRINNLTLAVSPRWYNAESLEEAIEMAEQATKNTALSVVYRKDGTAISKTTWNVDNENRQLFK
jgi:sulfur relay (sulfurtransferase) complex TusBCD TusD component (DsrE family)